MAESGRSFVTNFGAGTKSFEAGIDRMTESLRKLQKEYKNNTKEQKAASKEIKDAEKELALLEKEIQKNGKATEGQKKRQEELNDVIREAKKKLDDLKIAQAGLKNEIDSTKKKIEEQKNAMEKYKTSIDQIKDSAKDMGKDIAAAGAAAAAGMMVLDKVIFSTGKEFTATMSEVGAISGASAEQLEQLEQAARKYGATTQFSASEAAQALKYMALAGWDVQTSMTALPGILDLAAASGMDLAEASDMVTDYLSAFGMEADKAAYMADLMTYAQSNSNTSAKQLGEAWGNCAANLSAAGQDVETVTAMLEGLANNGIKGARAGTALTAIMRDISNQMEDGAISIGATSIAVQDANGNFRDLTDIMADVENATNGMGTAEKTAALSAVFTADSIKGVNTLLKAGIDNIADYEEALRSSTGSASEAAKKMNDNLTGDIKNLNSAFDEFKLKLFEDAESPMRDLVQTLTNDGIPALELIAKHINIIIPLFISAASAAGAYKAAVNILSIIKGISQATAALAVAKGAEKVATDEATASQAALNTVQAANPIGLVVAALSALIAGLTSYAAIADGSGKATGDFADELNRAANATKELNDQLDSAKNHYSDTIANAQATAAQLDALGKEYEKLRTQDDKTEGQQLLMNNIAEQLAKSMGKNIEDLKDEAGEYRDLTDEIDKYIEKLKQQAEVQAATELYGDAVKTRTKASVEYAALESKAKDYYAQHKDELDEYVLLGGREGSGRITDVTKKFEEFRTELSSLKSVYDEASESVDLYADKVEETVQAQNKQAAATNSSGAALDGVKGKIEEVGDAVDDVQAYADKMLNGEEGYDLKGFYELFRDTGEAADYLQERLTNANKALEDNRTEIKNTQDEIERLRKELNKPDITDEDAIIKGQQLEEAKEKLAQLRTEQVGLKEDVKSAQAEYKTAAWDAQTLSEKLSDIAKQSASVRSEMNSLANTYKSLSDGQQLSIDALLQLAEKYPEYAADIINANGSLEAQKEIVEKLFNLKKDELRLTLESARDAVQEENNKKEKLMDNLRDQIRTNENYLRVLKNLKLTSMDSYKTLITLTGNAKNQLAELNGEFNNGTDKIDAYNKAIESLKNFGVNNYGGNDNTNNNYNPTQTSAGNDSVQWTWGWMDEIGTGDTSAAARLSLVERVHQIGKINDNELKAEYEKILRQEQLTADESYSIRLKLKNLTDKLADAQLQKQNENAKKAQEYALAAYTKLINGQVEKLNDLNDAIKAGADRKVKEIDEQLEKRRQKQEDDSRKKELDAINLQLKYMHDDNETSRLSLEQRRQEILNEQAEADYQRRMEQKKLDIQNKANDKIDKNTAAMKNLNTTLENFSYLLAKASGTLSTQQIINNNNVTQNFEAVRGSALTQKQAQQFLKAIVSL